MSSVPGAIIHNHCAGVETEARGKAVACPRHRAGDRNASIGLLGSEAWVPVSE